MSFAPNMDPSGKLMELLAGKWVTAAVCAAAELGIADALDTRGMRVEELALALECDTEALRRLMRVLCGEELVEVDSDGVYTLTPVGAALRNGELRELARFVGAPFMWAPWTKLAAAVRGRGDAFKDSVGASLFEHLDSHPGDAAVYHAGVDAFTRKEARELARVFDFSTVQRLVDVGGGLGTLSLELLEHWPSLQCTLFDRPNVIAQARARLASERARERLATCDGDFFETELPRADAFVIKRVLHNWSDADAARILRNCVRSLEPGGRILIIDGVLLPGNVRDATRLMDLEMLVLCGAGGGRERTKPELRGLLHKSGLKLVSTHELAGATRLLVARRLSD